MPREYARTRRLSGQIVRVLNELLSRESKDPRLAGVTVTGTDVAGDLAVARVYFSLLDPDADPAVALEGLESAAGFLRSRLGRELEVRHVPELRFRHDDSIARGVELGRLIDEAGRGNGEGG